MQAAAAKHAAAHDLLQQAGWTRQQAASPQLGHALTLVSCHACHAPDPSPRVAPEVLLGNRQVGFACDIWSMGVVLWEASIV